MLRETLPTLTDRLSVGPYSVSPFCLGIVWDPVIIPAAFDAGINFFFVTADMHWPMYKHTRQGLELLLSRGGDVRDRIVVAGVSYSTQPEFCYMPYKELLDEVPRLDHLDIVIAGGAYENDLAQRLPVYQAHREKQNFGARAFGVSFHDRKLAARVASEREIDVGFIRYNPAHPGAREDLFPSLAAQHAPLFNFTNTIGYVTRERYAELGLDPEMWQPRVVDHYRYVMARPEIAGMLNQFREVEHIGALAEAMEEGPLEPEEMDHLELLCRIASGRSVVKT